MTGVCWRAAKNNAAQQEHPGKHPGKGGLGLLLHWPAKEFYRHPSAKGEGQFWKAESK
jgi:hypothetical protein